MVRSGTSSIRVNEEINCLLCETCDLDYLKCDLCVNQIRSLQNTSHYLKNKVMIEQTGHYNDWWEPRCFLFTDKQNCPKDIHHGHMITLRQSEITTYAEEPKCSETEHDRENQINFTQPKKNYPQTAPLYLSKQIVIYIQVSLVFIYYIDFTIQHLYPQLEYQNSFIKLTIK